MHVCVAGGNLPQCSAGPSPDTWYYSGEPPPCECKSNCFLSAMHAPTQTTHVHMQVGRSNVCQGVKEALDRAALLAATVDVAAHTVTPPVVVGVDEPSVLASSPSTNGHGTGKVETETATVPTAAQVATSENDAAGGTTKSRRPVLSGIKKPMGRGPMVRSGDEAGWNEGWEEGAGQWYK